MCNSSAFHLRISYALAQLVNFHLVHIVGSETMPQT